MTGDQRTEALARLRAELIEGGLIEGRDDGPPSEVHGNGDLVVAPRWQAKVATAFDRD